MTATIDTAFKTHLIAQASIALIVVERIYAGGEFPDHVVYPMITFEPTSDDHDRHMGGGSGLGTQRFQVNSRAKSYTVARALAEATRLVVDNFQRGLMGTTGNEVFVNAMTVEEGGIEDDFPTDKSHDGEHNAHFDCVIWHGEAVTP